MFFDMHADIWTNTLWEYEKGNKNIIRRKFRHKFEKGNMTGGIFVIWLDDYENSESRFIKALRIMSEELYYTKDFIHIVKNNEDFNTAKRNNKLAIILGIEGLSGIGKNLDYIYLLEQLGVRHIGLTWNESNAIATGQNGNPDRGLSELGIDALKIIEDLDILLDLSHANDKTFWDVAKYAKKPFFASHSNSRTLCPSMRNLTDDQLMCLKERNGMVGLNSYHNFVSHTNNKKTLDMFIQHLEYIAEKIGLDKVGFGFDFADYYSKEEEIVKDLKGLTDASDLNNIVSILKNRGYSNHEIDMITHRNFISFFNRVRNNKYQEEKR